MIHIDNGGVSNARKIGFNNSVGKYVTFVDADDYLPTNAVYILYNYLIQNSLEIVIGAHTNVFTNGEQKYCLSSTIFNRTEALRDLLSHGVISHSPWAKLFKRTLFNQETFINYSRGEDYLMCIDLVSRATKVGLVDDNVYYYVIRSGSAINTIKTNLEYEKKYFASMLNILKKNNVNICLYDRDLVSFNLWQMFALIMTKNELNINLDSYVQDIMVRCARYKENLTVKEKFIYYSVKYPILQYVLRLYIHLKERV